MHTKQLIDTIDRLNEREEALREVCSLIIDASLYWAGNDECKIPELKKIRTIAGYYLEKFDLK